MRCSCIGLQEYTKHSSIYWQNQHYILVSQLFTSRPTYERGEYIIVQRINQTDLDMKKTEKSLFMSQIVLKFPGRPSPSLVTILNELTQLLYLHRKQEMESTFMLLHGHIKYIYFVFMLIAVAARSKA